MAQVKVEHVNKIYPNGAQAVFDFCLDIEDQEFIVFVGPSGCGKSTTLRMIAGLEDISSGKVYIDGKFVNYIQPKDRHIAMVFQSYALYPNMSVYDNLAFGLKMRKRKFPLLDKEGNQVYGINEGKVKSLKRQIAKLEKALLKTPDHTELLTKKEELEKELLDVSTHEKAMYRLRHLTRSEIHERVMEAARILQIEEYLARKPKALSGGQRQRVAIGRAIVRNPKLFLMDEPLSNLDAKLRLQMRQEILRIHREIHATTIYVTHDQTEAMTMADRIVVMKAGHIQQIGTPREIYAHPANVFVATFIGSPAMNLMEGTYLKNKIKIDEESEVTLSKDFIDAIHSFYPNKISEFEKELQALEENFVERNEYLQKIEALKQELAHLEDKAKAKKEMELTHLQERLKECEENHSRRTYLLKALEVLKQVDVTKEVPMLFGIRPEGIIFKEDGPFSCVIETVELVGVEKLVHFTFKNEKMIAKVKNTKEIIEGETMYFDFDLKYFHIFDKETELTIL